MMDFEKFMAMSDDEQYAVALDNIAERAEKWQGDTPNDVLARMLLSMNRFLIEGLTEAKRVTQDGKGMPHPIMMVLILEFFTSLTEASHKLDALASLRDGL